MDEFGIAEICTALSKQLTAKLDRFCQVYDSVPDSINVPCIFARPLDGDLLADPGQGGEHNMIITVMVGRADLESAQNEIRPYLARTGSHSVKEAVESDRTLGGLISSIVVRRYRAVGVREFSGTLFFGVDFDLRLWE